jgi:hypothetical protein
LPIEIFAESTCPGKDFDFEIFIAEFGP